MGGVTFFKFSPVPLLLAFDLPFVRRPPFGSGRFPGQQCWRLKKVS